MHLKGYKSFPIIYGSSAFLIPLDQRINELTHKWKVYVKAPENAIKSVTFKLHESFSDPIKTLNEGPFEIDQYGWGEFTIQIKIILFNDERINFTHFLKLHGITNPVINEKQDTVFYKGKIKFKETDFKEFDDSSEYKRIGDAIDFLIDKLEKES